MSLTATSPRVSRLRISRATPKLPDPMSRTSSYLSMPFRFRTPAAGGGALACRGARGGREGGKEGRRQGERGEAGRRARRIGRVQEAGRWRRCGRGAGAVVSLSGVAPCWRCIYSRCTVGAGWGPPSVPLWRVREGSADLIYGSK